jgi:hypothetical protein
VGTYRSVSQHAGDVVESPFFSGVVTLSNAINDSTKSYHIWGLPAESVQVAYVDWREKCTCHVYQVSSNRYDSQI